MVDIVPFAAEPTAIGGLHVCTMKQVTDERGTIREFYRESAFVGAGLESLGPWAQVNLTETVSGGIRGLHGESMTKLVAVVAGAAHGAYVDARADSPSRGQVVQVHLVPGVQVLVPAGVCNGFQALDDGTQYAYCFDTEWEPGMPGVALNPLDPALGIEWPVAVDPEDLMQVSAKDRAAPLLSELFGSST